MLNRFNMLVLTEGNSFT